MWELELRSTQVKRFPRVTGLPVGLDYIISFLPTSLMTQIKTAGFGGKLLGLTFSVPH